MQLFEDRCRRISVLVEILLQGLEADAEPVLCEKPGLELLEQVLNHVQRNAEVAVNLQPSLVELVAAGYFHEQQFQQLLLYKQLRVAQPMPENRDDFLFRERKELQDLAVGVVEQAVAVAQLHTFEVRNQDEHHTGGI